MPARLSRPAAAEPTAALQEAIAPGATLRELLGRYERELIERAVHEAGGDRRLAARRLGIGLSSLYRKLGTAAPRARQPAG